MLLGGCVAKEILFGILGALHEEKRTFGTLLESLSIAVSTCSVRPWWGSRATRHALLAYFLFELIVRLLRVLAPCAGAAT